MKISDDMASSCSVRREKMVTYRSSLAIIPQYAEQIVNGDAIRQKTGKQNLKIPIKTPSTVGPAFVSMISAFEATNSLANRAARKKMRGKILAHAPYAPTLFRPESPAFAARPSASRCAGAENPMIKLPQTMPRWLPPLLFISALGAAFWRAPAPAAPSFALPPTAAPSLLPASFSSEMLPKAAEWMQATSLTQLPDGRLAAAWLAGSADGAEDVGIWYSTRGKAGWSKPLPIANRESTAGGTFAHVRGISTPVLYAEGSWLHLWYGSTGLGGAATNVLNHSVSTDAGKSWVKPTRLQTSPLANISTHVRTPPLPLADGGLGLPIHHTFIATYGEWLRLAPNGQILDKVRLPAESATLQPAVVALDAQRALALLRDAGPAPGKVQVATSDDGGLHWSAAVALPVPNPNAPIALLRLKSGRLLLAGNPQSGREALLLWLSADEGQTWQASRTVEAASDGGAEFAYPALLLGSDGRVNLAYTWRRQGIKHTVFSEAWLDGGQA